MPPSLSRRRFLKAAGFAVGAAGVAPFAEGFGPESVEAALVISTGFHWCSPVIPSNSSYAQGLLQQSGRWGAVIIMPSSRPGQVDPNFKDACDRVMAARSAVGGGASLDQSILRLYWGTPQDPGIFGLKTVAAADAWLRGNGFYDNINYYVSNGGRMLIPFNELNVTAEPQFNLDPLPLGCLAYALDNAYYNGGNRQLYTLFPGPSGLLGPKAGNWQYGFFDYLARYDLWKNGVPQTFDQVYGSGVDPLLHGRTMFYHGGRGVFDRVSLHCYASTPAEFSNPSPKANRALQYLAWMPYADSTSSIFVTESSGASGTDGNSQAAAGVALADFEYNANKLYAPRLQAIHGFILQQSQGATSTPAQLIDYPFLNGANGNPGYNARRMQLGF